MTPQAVIALLANTKKWKKGNERAPHKPLLLLLALGKLSRGDASPMPYRQVEEPLRNLLVEFGPARKSYHPEHPFMRLANDGIWQLDHDLDTKADPSSGRLRELNPAGELTPDIRNALLADTALLEQAVQLILDDNFPPTLHDDIRAACGIQETDVLVRRAKRDPRFREQVIVAYEYRCAVCAFDLRIGNAPAAIEAAHVRWHAHAGPDTVDNGIALCTMHHKLFDLGAYTVDRDRIIRISALTNGSGKDHWLMPYDEKEIRKPQKQYDLPNPDFLGWHVKEVFKGYGI
jgi:putative restriction endonuclease